MTEISNIRPGETIAGKYVVERLLGEGGMGVVVVALHTQLEQKVAIKFLKTEALQNAEAVSRFVREARAAARIQSEHVVRVYDVSTLEGGAPYLVMEHLEGRDLDATIRVNGPVAVGDALTYVLEACEALAQAHKAGIVHRDLKPANLFLAETADGSLTVKILDFGISKLSARPGSAAEVSMTRTSAVMGSPLYMAPEQMRSTRAVDHRADIWSLGIILYEALAGGPPFMADTLTEVCAMILTEPPQSINLRRQGLPPELEPIILRCLEKQPENRYPDVAELAAAIAPFAPPETRRMVDGIIRIVHGAGGLPSRKLAAALPFPGVTTSSVSSGASGMTAGLSGTGVTSNSAIAGPLALASSSTNHVAGSAPVFHATAHSFGTTGGGGAAPVPKALWAVVGVVGLIVLVGGGFLVRAITKKETPHADVASNTAMAPGSVVAGTSTTALSLTSLPEMPSGIATTSTTALGGNATPTTSTATLAAPSSSTAQQALTATNRQPTTATTKPTGTKPGTKPTSTKPASTSGFGGRE